MAVELGRRQAPEIPDTGQRDRQQPVKELPHPHTAQSDLGADRHPLAQLELRDGLASPLYLRFLSSDHSKIPHGAVHQFGIPSGLADAHVYYDLDHPGYLHRVGVIELLTHRANDFLAVPGLEPRHRRRTVAFYRRSLSHLRRPCRCAAIRARACPRHQCGNPPWPACRWSRRP